VHVILARCLKSGHGLLINPKGVSLYMLDSALQYAGYGWFVFPLKPHSKEPAIKAWNTRASNNSKQIRNWWRQFPNANIGILTGRKSGVFVVDIDPKNGGDESICHILNGQNKFPETATQKTGSGGSHILFSYPDQQVKTRRGYPDTGIDICSDGGYIVAAPSIHPNGNTYQWTIDPCNIKPPPEWLTELLRKESKKPIEQEGIIKEGIRNDQLFRLGCSLRAQGVSKKDMGVEIHRINTYQCDPPLPDDEVNVIIDSVNQQINQEKPPLFRFRDYVRSDTFPRDPTLRHILHALSFYMDENGNRCYPTMDQLASDTGYSRRTISIKLKGAVSDKYILRSEHKQDGQQYPNYIYYLPRRFMETKKPCDSETGGMSSGSH
jgi:hypothetical protein